MRNAEINSVVENLLKSYSAVTGVTKPPTLDEYIRLREHAASSIHAGVVFDTCESAPRPASMEKPSIEKEKTTVSPVKRTQAEEPVKNPLEDLRPVLPKKRKESAKAEAPAAPVRHEAPAISLLPDNPETEDKKPSVKSDYEILKSLQDEWN